MIYGEYSKFWDYWHDYSSLYFYEFLLRINSLKGQFGDVINLRYKYLKGQKMDKEERRIAMKNLNSEQISFMEVKRTDKMIAKGETIKDSIRMIIESNIAANKKKRGIQERKNEKKAR